MTTRMGLVGPLGAFDLIEDKDPAVSTGTGGSLLLIGAGSWLLAVFGDWL